MLELVLSGSRRNRLQVRGLRFPFPVAAEIECGECAVWLPGEMRDPDALAPEWIPPLELVNVGVAPDSRVSFRRLLPSDPHATPQRAPSRDKPVTAALSFAVFGLPDAAWHAGAATLALGLNSSAMLSRQLLKEGECLRDIVITQRLMRVLFDLAGGQPLSLAPHRYGFPDRCRLENALFDRFCLIPDLLAQPPSGFDRAA